MKFIEKVYFKLQSCIVYIRLQGKIYSLLLFFIETENDLDLTGSDTFLKMLLEKKMTVS